MLGITTHELPEIARTSTVEELATTLSMVLADVPPAHLSRSEDFDSEPSTEEVEPQCKKNKKHEEKNKKKEEKTKKIGKPKKQ